MNNHHDTTAHQSDQPIFLALKISVGVMLACWAALFVWGRALGINSQDFAGISGAGHLALDTLILAALLGQILTWTGVLFIGIAFAIRRFASGSSGVTPIRVQRENAERATTQHAA